MNLVGKIFIVLIFIMSLLWMGFTVAVYATHKNWRHYVMNEDDGLVHQLSDVRSRVDELKAERDQLEAELEQERTFKRQALAKLETENDELSQQLDQREKEYASEVQERREAVAALDATNARLKAREEELATLRAEIRQVQEDRDAKMKQVVELTDELHQAVLSYENLSKTHKTLEDDSAEMKKRLRISGLPVPPQPWEPPAPADFEGVVLAVGQDQIEMTGGTDDGIQKGQRLDVVRGNNYLGRVEVIQTEPDKAVAKIVREMQQHEIQRGDRVYPQLSSR